MKKPYIAIASLALLSLVTLAAFPVYAAGTDNPVSNGVKKIGEMMHGKNNWNNLTDQEKADSKAKMDARKAEMDTKRTAIKNALAANDYNAWVAAVGTTSPIAKKITQSNFSEYVAAYNLMKQAQEKFKALGLDQGELRGIGHGGMMGFGEMRGPGMMESGQTANQ